MTDTTYAGNPIIPSEIIEPHLKRFLMMQIEAVACGLTTPQQAKNYLEGVDYFVSSTCGIHARYATSNIYGRFRDLQDNELLKICKTILAKQNGA